MRDVDRRLSRQAIRTLQFIQCGACWFAAVAGAHIWSLGVLLALGASIIAARGTLGLLDELDPPDSNTDDRTG